MQVWWCCSCAISATRIYVQVERQIQTDPCDNRIIVCTVTLVGALALHVHLLSLTD